jgi:hypothetical protein
VILDYPRLAGLIRTGDADAVAGALVAADEKARTALVPDLRRYLEEISRDWQRRRIETRALVVAGVGCVPGVAGVVSWLRRPEFRGPYGLDPGAVVRVLSAPGRPSIAVVGRRLADRMRVSTIDSDWPIAAALVSAAGAEPPAGDAFVRGWARYRLRMSPPRRPLVGVLRDDPWLPAMAARIFDVDGLAAELGRDWPQALAELCAEGRIEREQVLAGCLRRMRAGERPGPMGRIMTTLGLLDATPDEIAAHRQEYLGLLSSPSPSVAKHGQSALRRLDAAGRLPAEAVTEASEAVLLRSEKELVRAQLGWLDSVAARCPGQLAQLLGAAATGLGNEAPDLADRALEVIARHLPKASDQARNVVRAALPPLTGDLARRMAGLLGVEAGDVTAPASAAGLPPTESAPQMPPPIGSVGELAREVARVLTGLPTRTIAAVPSPSRPWRGALARSARPWRSRWHMGWPPSANVTGCRRLTRWSCSPAGASSPEPCWARNSPR